MSKRTYDIFISYRRDGGINSAVALQSTLLQMNYKAFLDVNNLQSGKFDEALFHVIDHCKDFLLVLSPHALDRCGEPDDWVRKEVERAMQMNKNIIPIICDGGDVNELFTNAVPENMKELLRYQVLKTNVVELQAMMVLLRTNLHSRPALAPQKKMKWVLIGLLAIGLLAFGGYHLHRYMNTFPRTRQEQNLVKEVTAPLLENLQLFEQGQQQYLTALAEAKSYAASMSRTEVERTYLSTHLTGGIKILQALENKIHDIEPTVVERAAKTPLSSADIAQQPKTIRSHLKSMSQNLYYLEKDLIDADYALQSDKVKWIEIQQEKADIRSDRLIHSINQIFLTTDARALAGLKAELEAMSDQPWQESETAFSAADDRLLSREKEQEDLLSTLQAQYARQQEHETELAVQRVEAKAQKLEESKQELEERKNALREQLRPQLSDSYDALWRKALIALGANLYDTAIENFTMCEVVADEENLKQCARAAARFAEYIPETGITDGIIVYQHEEGKEPQPGLKIGDIIWQVNGTTIHSFADYTAAKGDNKESTLYVLRFQPSGGYEMVSLQLSKDCGGFFIYSLNMYEIPN